MKRFLLFILLIPLWVVAEWDLSFLEEDEPGIVENVNVITGNLNLCFQEKVIRGAIPFPVTLTYSSRGAAEARDDESLKLKKLRNVLELDGGWSLLPHLTLLVDTRERNRPYSSVMDPNGAVVVFDWKGKPCTCSGSLNGRKNPSNHSLELNLKKGEATLYLADGGVRIYRGEKEFFFAFLEETDLPRKNFRYLMLVEERLPSGHRIFYDYSQDEYFEKIIAIRVMNPAGVKTFTKVVLKGDLFQKRDFKTLLLASDGTVIKFGHRKYKERKYLTFDDCQHMLAKQFSYTKVRKGVGLSLEKVAVGDRETLMVEYYGPADEKQSEKWKEKPNKKPYEIDKVKSIKNPAGIQATFSYVPGITSVRDAHGVLTRYHHSQGKIDLIEYFGEGDEPISSQTFQWSDGLLSEKTMKDALGHPIFSKSFAYDSYKNVVKETIYSASESFTKWYEYNDNHLLSVEREEEGPTYRYSYFGDTDLISRKQTCDGEKVLFEESFVYDEDHLLIEKRVFGGTCELVTEWKRDWETGMILEKIEPLGRTVYTYNNKKLPIQEDVFDAEGEYRYSLFTEYDNADRVIRQTTPMGAVNRYSYDRFGNPTEIKEVGAAKKQIQYDALDRPVCVEMNGKTSFVTYDPKGWVLSRTDDRGQVTSHKYDPFGKCVETILPDGNHLYFAYDPRGNLVASTDGNGYTTYVDYNLFQKPVHIREPNGAETIHSYYANGELKETVLPEGGRVNYGYDALHRLIAKRQGGHEERWEYEGALLKSYLGPTGLLTRFLYDRYGRKIEELVGGRKGQFFYNALGFVEKTVSGEYVHFQRVDIEGKILEESENGFHQTLYTYDQEGRKTQAQRGEAVDRFQYDEEGRLISHVDPMGYETRILYGIDSMTTIDPCGNMTVETYDPLDRLKKTERKTPDGCTCAREEFVYDGAGNKVKQLTTVFKGDKADRIIEVDFEYNSVNLLTREIEANQKVTTFAYDKQGRVVRCISPNGVSLFYTYDDRDCVTEMISSDGTVHYRYEYEHTRPVAITDVLKGKTLARSYTPYGEVAKEEYLQQNAWQYDDNGRVIAFTLPDGTSVHYSYENGHMCKVARVKQGRCVYAHSYLEFDRNCHVEEEGLIKDLGRIRTKHDLLERAVEVISPFHERALAFGPSGLVKGKDQKEYRYDPLNQLIQEGDKGYQFDSLGNPSKYVINDLNQITATEGEILHYDPNGNLIERRRKEGTIYYRYDALQRLISATYPDGRRVLYQYDPLSRLCTMDFGYVKRHLIYDHEFEIGMMENGEIKELKVLGLGVKGDIGAAVALEFNGEVFAPLHDLQGNIVAIVNSEGHICETYPFNAFGFETFHDYQNPWRFSSKRAMDGLIFFGKRFYDPSLMRWLTPDPLGIAGGRNLYAYVLNNPMNRLDLFGLYGIINIGIAGEGKGTVGFKYSNNVYGPPKASYDGYLPTVLFGRGEVNGFFADFIFICTRPIKLNFTPEEHGQMQFNLFDHLPEILPAYTNKLSFATYSNGMDNAFSDWMDMGRELADHLPEGLPILSVYNPSFGALSDLDRVADELAGVITPPTHALHQFFIELNDQLDTINPDAKWLHIAHSEGGLQTVNAGDFLQDRYRKKMKDRLYYLGVAPAKVATKDFGHAKNIYSNKDRITLRYAKRYLNNPSYDIKILDCISPKEELGWFSGDHSFSNATYQKGMKDHFKELDRTVGFYVENRR